MSQQCGLPESMAWHIVGTVESEETQRSVVKAVGVARNALARLVCHDACKSKAL